MHKKYNTISPPKKKSGRSDDNNTIWLSFGKHKHIEQTNRSKRMHYILQVNNLNFYCLYAFCLSCTLCILFKIFRPVIVFKTKKSKK